MKKVDNMFLINKKAQSQIITTVLIILLVLAAIVIVWQVVNTTIKSGSDEVTNQAACIGISMEVLSANNGAGNNVVVRRNTGAASQEKVIAVVFVDGTKNDTGASTGLGQLDSENFAISGLVFGQKVQVAAKLNEEVICALSEKFTVTAA